MNRLFTEQRAQILSMTVEGVSLRAISRLTGAGKNTLAGMLAKFGSVCAAYHNQTVRGVRRFTRLTNGFSKKIDNHIAAVAIYFMHYNFCRAHQSLRITPAMAAGLTDHIWSVEEVCRLAKTPANPCRQIERMMTAKALGESVENRREA